METAPMEMAPTAPTLETAFIHEALRNPLSCWLIYRTLWARGFPRQFYFRHSLNGTFAKHWCANSPNHTATILQFLPNWGKNTVALANSKKNCWAWWDWNSGIGHPHVHAQQGPVDQLPHPPHVWLRKSPCCSKSKQRLSELIHIISEYAETC